MEVITPGYLYLLGDFEIGNPDPLPNRGQKLQFLQGETQGDKFVTLHAGTYNEELIEVLIDRLKFLNSKATHPDNDEAIDSLETALAALNHRTEERRSRGVEGTTAK